MAPIRNVKVLPRANYLLVIIVVALIGIMTFASVSEAAVPQVVSGSESPVTGALNAATSGNASISFNINIIANSSSSLQGITIKRDGLGINLVSATPTIAGGTTLIIPYSGLIANAEYEVHIPAGAVKNVNDVNREITWYFTTYSELPVGLAPVTAYNGRNPAPNETGISINFQNVTVKFRYPIEIPAINVFQDILVRDSFDNRINFASGPNASSIIADSLGRMTILNIPISQLEPGQSYEVLIPQAAIKYIGGISNNQVVIHWAFTAEKKPKPVTFSFQPSGITFKLKEYPFNMSNYPALAGIEKHGIPVNQTIVIEFDDDIKLGTSAQHLITISGAPIDPGISPVPIIEENRLIIKLERLGASFQNNILNYGTVYTVTIPAQVLADARGGNLTNEPIQFKFQTVHNFDNLIIKGSMLELNNILRTHPPRNIAVVVPKKYITEVQTIHHIRGLVPIGGTLPNAQQNLTNIDIKADNDVFSIRVETNRGIRTLSRNKQGIFTTGYAGLEADGLTEIRIYALDRYGKLSEMKDMKLEIDGNSPLKIYNFAMPQNLQGTHSLYNLMLNSTLLNDILLHFPVTQLRNIGMYFPFDW